jgi:signal transduction histidine kinase
MVLEAGPTVAVKASAGVLSVAITNVLENAIKFSGPGGRVTVTVKREDRDAVIAVADTGPGLSPEDIPLVFERFHRGSVPRSTGTPGVGLGLAICRAVVERQGGRVSVTSTPGEGTTFMLRFPLAAEIPHIVT